MKRSTLACATVSSLRPARVRMAWCMVGTALYQVGFTSASQEKKRKASKPGEQLTLAPAARVASTGATRPWMWNSGMTLRQRSDGARASVATMLAAEAQRLAWLSGTIFGREVVPEVCRMRATASPARSATGASAAPSKANSPALSPSRSEMTGMPRAFATLDGGRLGTGIDDQGAGVEIVEIELELALLVTRIQRRGCTPRRHADESARGQGAVREHDGDAIGRGDSRPTQLTPHSLNLVPKATIAAPGTPRRTDGFRVVGDRRVGGTSSGDKLGQGLQQSISPRQGTSCSQRPQRQPITSRGWSGRQDLNLRPPHPQCDALPDCATPRRKGTIAARRPAQF